jgi:hypothetical protein
LQLGDYSNAVDAYELAEPQEVLNRIPGTFFDEVVRTVLLEMIE